MFYKIYRSDWIILTIDNELYFLYVEVVLTIRKYSLYMVNAKEYNLEEKYNGAPNNFDKYSYYAGNPNMNKVVNFNIKNEPVLVYVSQYPYISNDLRRISVPKLEVNEKNVKQLEVNYEVNNQEESKNSFENPQYSANYEKLIYYIILLTRKWLKISEKESILMYDLINIPYFLSEYLTQFGFTDLEKKLYYKGLVNFVDKKVEHLNIVDEDLNSATEECIKKQKLMHYIKLGEEYNFVPDKRENLIIEGLQLEQKYARIFGWRGECKEEKERVNKRGKKETREERISKKVLKNEIDGIYFNNGIKGLKSSISKYNGDKLNYLVDYLRERMMEEEELKKKKSENWLGKKLNKDFFI